MDRTTEFGVPQIQSRLGLLCLGSCGSHRKISTLFGSLLGQTEFKTVHFSYFRIKAATMGCRTFSGFAMESPTGFSTITWLQRNPNLDSEEHSIFHKQIGAFDLILLDFHLVNFQDKGLSYSSHFTRVRQSKTTKGMRSNSIRTDKCRLRYICK
ncbi:hypothetical protein FHG87_000807 [Trinorchestia longiramus]|nr:hypothetical protein FHG87_000807 [Trinorchestia longiramus]